MSKAATVRRNETFAERWDVLLFCFDKAKSPCHTTAFVIVTCINAHEMIHSYLFTTQPPAAISKLYTLKKKKEKETTLSPLSRRQPSKES